MTVGTGLEVPRYQPEDRSTRGLSALAMTQRQEAPRSSQAWRASASAAEGLSDAPGRQTLTTPLKARGSRRYGLAHLGTGAKTGRAFVAQEVRLTTIDAFAAKEGLERLDFIKADVEGWELRMLLGGARTIERTRPALMIELEATHLPRAGDTLEGAWDTLLSWEYRPWLWLGGEDLEPIPGPRSGDAFWLPE